MAVHQEVLGEGRKIRKTIDQVSPALP